MGEEYKEITGYHGSEREKCNQIVSEQKFIPGKDEDNEDFLGRGVYFFLSNEHAVWWNLKKAKDKGKVNLKYNDYIDSYAVVSAQIVVPKNNVLDFENISDVVKYDKICRRFQKEFEDDEEYANAKYKDRAIINFLYKRGYMDDIYVIRKIIGQKTNTVDLNVGDYLQRNIICVKNDKIINNIKIEKNIENYVYNNIRYISFY